MALVASNKAGTRASNFLHSLLVDQLYDAKKVSSCSFVTKFNQKCIKYLPKCF